MQNTHLIDKHVYTMDIDVYSDAEKEFDKYQKWLSDLDEDGFDKYEWWAMNAITVEDFEDYIRDLQIEDMRKQAQDEQQNYDRYL